MQAMRSFLIAASIAGLLTLTAWGQSQDHPSGNDSKQQTPDAPEPQTQKKTPPAQPPSSGDKTGSPESDGKSPSAAKPDAAGDQVPESDSSAGQKTGSGSHGSTAEANPFPEAVSRDAAKAASGAKSTAEDNPFPESVSRDAAKAAGNAPPPEATPAPRANLPPGVSSSESSSSADDVNEVPGNDPVRAKKDAEVGKFYLATGDYKGALMRYQDATASDPTNVEAIYGLAEAQRAMKKDADAMKSYELYLTIVPNGSHAKEALKALKTLEAAR